MTNTTTFPGITVATVATAFGWTQDGPAFHTVNNDTVYSDEPYRFSYVPGAFDEETGDYVGSCGDYEAGAKFHAEREANGLNKSLLNFFGNGKTLGEDIYLAQYRKANRYGVDQFIIVAFDEASDEIAFWAHADSGESYDDGRIAVMCSSKSLAIHGEYTPGIGGSQRWLLGALVDQMANI